jgi:hypothetical protein
VPLAQHIESLRRFAESDVMRELKAR